MSPSDQTGDRPFGIGNQPFATAHLGLLRPIAGQSQIQTWVNASLSTETMGSEPGGPALKTADLTYFEIRDVPGKGRGIIARGGTEKGTEIFEETPLVVPLA